MSQLTIYLDTDSMKRIKSAARRDRTSVSRWARARLCEGLQHAWPPDYFALFGALRESGLERPPQGAFADDAPRGTL
jgi:hypothetical protein